MSKYNGRKKRSTFTNRGAAPAGIPQPMSPHAQKMLRKHMELLRNHNPMQYIAMTTRITKRGRKQHYPIGY